MVSSDRNDVEGIKTLGTVHKFQWRGGGGRQRLGVRKKTLTPPFLDDKLA